jgi:phosphoribosyl-AMP cyclohydrolase
MTTSDAVKWDERGLVPAIVQEAATGAVLMMAWMNAEALRLCHATGETHFWRIATETFFSFLSSRLAPPATQVNTHVSIGF